MYILDILFYKKEYIHNMFITSKKSCRTTKHFRVKCHLQLGCKIFNWNEKDILVKDDYFPYF